MGSHFEYYASPLFLLAVLFAFVVLRGVYKVFRNPLSSLPGPQLSKWSSLLVTYYWLRGQRVNYVHSLHQKYGPIVRVSPDEVHISDISAAREIHKVGGRYLKSEWYRILVPRRIENVFSTTDPKRHSVHRRLLSAPMADASLKRFEPIISSRVRLAVDKIADEMKNRGVADVFKWWTFMATDVIGELSFGESFRMLEHGKENQFVFDLQKIGSLQSIRTAFPFLTNLSGFLPIPWFREVAKAGMRISMYTRQSIARYRKQLGSDPKPTLMTPLFNAGGEDGLSEWDIICEAQGYIVAGSDTTAVTLAYLVYAVCRDQKVRERLVAELATLPEDFTEQDTRELPYLGQVINETLRLYSAAPSALKRVVPPEGAYLAGYPLPGGVTVSTQAYTFHRDPTIFPDPERYDPNRWTSPTNEMKSAFMPFGAGSRICLGMHLAKIELRFATALFFRTFPHARVSTKEGMSDEDMKPLIWFLSSPKGHRCLIEV